MNSPPIKKPLKDKDSRETIYFVRVYGYMYMITSIVTIWITRNFFYGLLLAIVFNFIPTYLVLYFTERSAGGFANMLYGTGRRTITDHERLESDMQQATYFKNSKNYDKAKEIVDRVLDQEPNHAEALFLKSKILYEGFGDAKNARDVLNKIFQIGPDKVPTIHNWAAHYYQEINRKESGE
jgi:tetratricopeptide (TPR) repeat protein